MRGNGEGPTTIYRDIWCGGVKERSWYEVGGGGGVGRDLFWLEIQVNSGSKPDYKGGRDLGTERIPSTFTKRKLISFVNGFSNLNNHQWV